MENTWALDWRDSIYLDCIDYWPIKVGSGHVFAPCQSVRGEGDKNNINYPELVTVEGWSRGSIFSLLWYFSVKTGAGGCNSRLFLSSFIAAGKKNIMRETNFNRKSHFTSLFWRRRKSIQRLTNIFSRLLTLTPNCLFGETFLPLAYLKTRWLLLNQ